MSIGIVIDSIVLIASRRRDQFPQYIDNISAKSGFIFINNNTGCGMAGMYHTQSVQNSAVVNFTFDIFSNVYEFNPGTGRYLHMSTPSQTILNHTGAYMQPDSVLPCLLSCRLKWNKLWYPAKRMKDRRLQHTEFHQLTKPR